MPADLYPWMHLVGRILFALIFIMSGMSHLMQRQAMTEHARSRGIPAAGAAVVLSGLVIIAGGLMVASGWSRFIGAGLLAIFLLLTALLMHPFWKEEDEQVKMNEMSHFLKDLALCGAALLIAYYAGDPWPMSL